MPVWAELTPSDAHVPYGKRACDHEDEALTFVFWYVARAQRKLARRSRREIRFSA
jgi:hypothetical protein